MTAFITTLRLLIRLAFVVLLLLGLYIWYSGAAELVGAHMAVGFVFVLLLWALCVAGAMAGASKGLVALTAAWGLLLPIVGIGQLHMMLGSAHWVVRVVHLLVGLAAMPFAERLARQALEKRAVSSER